MAHAVGTQLWVKCEDGDWWPAVVQKADEDLLRAFGCEHNICVEFYHDRGNLYPIAAANANSVRLLHRAEAERDEAERPLFVAAGTQHAVRLALQDTARPAAPRAVGPVPFSAQELRCMSALLGAIRPATAAQLRRALETHGGADLSAAGIRQVEAREQKRRKRSAPPPTVSVGCAEAKAFRPERGSRPIRETAPVDIRETAPVDIRETAPVDICETAPVDIRETAPVDIRETAPVDIRETAPVDMGSSPPVADFREAFSTSALDVIRREVFDSGRLVLSPLYRYLDVLGAVAVEGTAVSTTLPAPHALREAPRGGFSPSRRVVLVALSSAALDHTAGWMVPIEYEGATVAMRLAVNGAAVAVPPNWALPAGREAAAVKTAPAADVTDLVMREECFSLEVTFTGAIGDAALWDGVIVAVFVDASDVDALAHRIVSNYRPPQRRREATDDVVGVQVRATCPLTTLPLKVPVRGALCEHGQCVELRSLLLHCTRTNIWNCPLCWAPTTPQSMVVNYRLKEWLDSNGRRLADVDFILETPAGKPLRAIWKQKKSVDERVIAID